MSRCVDNVLLVGMGNPLLDISADVEMDLLTKYDVKLGSAILAEDKHQPLYKELVDGYKVKYIAGGATQNTCRIAQWLLTANGKATNSVAFMGCVGEDEYGKELAETASNDGVLVHYMKSTDTPTGTCAALIVGGERSLVTNLGAANEFKPSHLETDVAKKLMSSAELYYCAGFFLTVSVESLTQVAEAAASRQKKFALNLSAEFIIQFFGDQLATALEYSDYIFGNETEAGTYGKKHGIIDDAENVSDEDMIKVAKALQAAPKKTDGPRTVVLTQGSKATIVCTAPDATQVFAVEELPKDQLVDTNGAGDAFVGGFLGATALGKDLADAVNAGHWTARYIIQQSGTTLPDKCSYTF